MFNYDQCESYEKRLLNFMIYVDNYGMPSKKCRVRFCDIISNSNDLTFIINWFVSQTNVNNIDKFMSEYPKYKDIYVDAYKLINDRVVSLIEKRKREIPNEEDSVKIFMNYINTNDIPKGNSDIRFCNISNNLSDDRMVGRWFLNRLYDYRRSAFFNYIFKYKHVYSVAYEKVLKLVKDMRNKKDSKLSFEDSMKVLMEYISINNVPGIYDSLRFCDIGNNGDTRIIGNWLEYNINYNLNKFIKECSKYKESNYVSYVKICKYVKDIDSKLLFVDKVELFMMYIDNHDIPNSRNKLRFCDIYKNIDYDAVVSSWYMVNLSRNIYAFMGACEKIKDKYPKAYLKVAKRVLSINNRKNNRLDFENSVYVFMKYANVVESIDKNISFSDIYVCYDSRNVDDWFNYHCSSNVSNLLNECDKWKDDYPNAYNKIIANINKILDRKENKNSYKKKDVMDERKNEFSYEDKVRTFMEYVNDNEMLKTNSDLRFCDIGDNSCSRRVGGWLFYNVYDNVTKFYKEYSKYKDIYPIAFLNVTDYINKSRIRLNKARMGLIDTLDVISGSKKKILK